MSDIAALQAYFAVQDDVLLAYLFGSRACDQAAPASDYDLALLACEVLPPARRYQLAHELAVLLGGASVDLVVLNRVPIELAYAVVATGQRLFECDLATRVEFEAGVLSRYGDMLPVLRQQRADLIQGGTYDAGVRRHRAAFDQTERVLAEIRTATQQEEPPMKTLVLSTDAPIVTGPPQGHWTYADWETLPDDGNRYEVIDGVLYMTTAPSYFHQWIVMRLVRYIGIPAEDQGLAFAVTAPIGVLMPHCDPVQPDFVVVLKTNAAIIHAGKIRGVPDLIIEVQSPGNAAYDEAVKLLAYARAGVPEYAIINPRARTVSHYRLLAPGAYAAPRVASETERISFACLPSITVPVADLFAGAPDTTL